MMRLARALIGPLSLASFGLSFASLSACAPLAAIDLGAHDVTLSATDAALFESLRSLVFTFYDAEKAANACATLVNLPTADLDNGERAPEAVQALDLDTRRIEHTFGAVDVDAATTKAFLVLGSPDLVDAADPLADLIARNGVTAIGCHDLVVEPGTRYDVPIVLFPAGRR